MEHPGRPDSSFKLAVGKRSLSLRCCLQVAAKSKSGQTSCGLESRVNGQSSGLNPERAIPTILSDNLGDSEGKRRCGDRPNHPKKLFLQSYSQQETGSKRKHCLVNSNPDDPRQQSVDVLIVPKQRPHRFVKADVDE